MGEFLSQAAAREAHKVKLRARNPDFPEDVIDRLTPEYPVGTYEYAQAELRPRRRFDYNKPEERRRGKNQ